MKEKTFVFILFIFFSGCTYQKISSPNQPTFPSTVVSSSRKVYYQVQKGDSLWKISKLYGVPIEKIMEENNLYNPSLLKEGQSLLIPLPTGSYKNKELLLFPVEGKIINYFGEVVSNRVNKGIKIQTNEDAAVHASMDGKVTFTGYLKGYGNTIIIEHPNGFSTVYSSLSDINVKDGDRVKRRQIIGRVGITPQKSLYILHFEVRKGRKAENPLKYVSY